MSQVARDALAFWATFGVVLALVALALRPWWGQIAGAAERWLCGDSPEEWPEGFEDDDRA